MPGVGLAGHKAAGQGRPGRGLLSRGGDRVQSRKGCGRGTPILRTPEQMARFRAGLTVVVNSQYLKTRHATAKLYGPNSDLWRKKKLPTKTKPNV